MQYDKDETLQQHTQIFQMASIFKKKRWEAKLIYLWNQH